MKWLEQLQDPWFASSCGVCLAGFCASCLWQEAQYTLDWFPGYDRGHTQRQTSIHLTFTPTGRLECPANQTVTLD